MARNWYLLEKITELNIEMASLELEETESNTTTTGNTPTENLEKLENSQTIRRSLRTRNKVKHFSVEHTQTTKLKKGNKNDVQQVKRLPSTLETIYEEPKSMNDKLQYMSIKKFKRTLSFSDESSTTSCKTKRSKKRLMKAKKVSAANRIGKRKKLSMHILLEKLQSIETTD